MENSIYVGLSRQMVLNTNMDIIANNIANANTPGFRAQNLLFKEYVSNPKGNDAPLSFVEDFGQYQNTEQGPMHYTGNPLNVGLNGPGFLGVVGPGGKTAYTRAGEFELSQDGTLITPNGDAVADQGGAPITIPNDTTEIHIDNKGVISNQSGQIGQLMVVEFDNAQKLAPIGNNLYTTTETGKPAEHTAVKDGLIEGSNVKPVIEMTRMIDTLRSFQNVQQVLQSENDRIRSAIQQLTQST